MSLEDEKRPAECQIVAEVTRSLANTLPWGQNQGIIEWTTDSLTHTRRRRHILILIKGTGRVGACRGRPEARPCAEVELPDYEPALRDGANH